MVSSQKQEAEKKQLLLSARYFCVNVPPLSIHCITFTHLHNSDTLTFITPYRYFRISTLCRQKVRRYQHLGNFFNESPNNQETFCA